MKRPRYTKQGDLDIQSIAELSQGDLRDWVWERLHGDDPAFGSAPGQMPHYLFFLIYPKLNPLTRENLQTIILDFIRDLGQDPKSAWQGEAGDELLQLVDPILVDSPRKQEAVDLLLQIVDSPQIFGRSEPNLHLRALQGLVTLGYAGNANFWLRQFASGGDRYAPVVLEGLALIDVSDAFDWLTDVGWTDQVEDAIIGFLPSLLETHGAGEIVPLLAQTLQKLPKRGREAIQRFADEEDLPITSFVSRVKREDWAKDKMRLQGRIAVVTGSSRGIGRAIALAFAKEGADVVINYQRNEKLAKELAQEIEKTGRKAQTVQADVSDPKQVRRMRDTILQRFERVDILVNNAGINRDKNFSKMDEEAWKSVLSVNLDGAFYCTQAFFEGMVARGYGRIINVSSIVGQMGNFGQANYAAAKSGLLGLTKTLARELAGKGITVNAVAPGFIETGMVAGIPNDVKERIFAQIPLRRFGRPEEVAEAVVFLASDDSSYITGHVLNVNGGMYM